MALIFIAHLTEFHSISAGHQSREVICTIGHSHLLLSASHNAHFHVCHGVSTAGNGSAQRRHTFGNDQESGLGEITRKSSCGRRSHGIVSCGIRGQLASPVVSHGLSLEVIVVVKIHRIHGTIGIEQQGSARVRIGSIQRNNDIVLSGGKAQSAIKDQSESIQDPAGGEISLGSASQPELHRFI